MVYGDRLTVSEDFVPKTANEHSNADPHLHQLGEWVRTLAPVPTSQHGMVPFHVPHNLQETQFVFVRWDAHHTSLQQPNECPYNVIQAGPKTFTLDIGGKSEAVSVDHLKPTHLDLEHPPKEAKPRCRGRPPKPSKPPLDHITVQASSTVQPQYSRCGQRIKGPLRFLGSGGSGVAA